MGDELTHILAEERRREAEQKDWEDIRFFSDEEIIMMYPVTEREKQDFEHLKSVEEPPDYSADDYFRLLELDQALEELLDSIKSDEEALKDGSISSIQRSELLSDLKSDRLKQARILQEMAEINNKYERHTGPIR